MLQRISLDHTSTMGEHVVHKFEINCLFGRYDVVESFKFHPELIFKFLRDSEFYSKF